MLAPPPSRRGFAAGSFVGDHLIGVRLCHGLGGRCACWCRLRRHRPTRRQPPADIPGLSNQAREAVNAAFDAMSAWRNETAEASEKNSKVVIEKMAAAAAALG